MFASGSKTKTVVNTKPVKKTVARNPLRGGTRSVNGVSANNATTFSTKTSQVKAHTAIITSSATATTMTQKNTKTGGGTATKAARKLTPATKSKFTERKMLVSSASGSVATPKMQPQRTRSLRFEAKSSASTTVPAKSSTARAAASSTISRKHEPVEKRRPTVTASAPTHNRPLHMPPIHTSVIPVPRARLWGRRDGKYVEVGKLNDKLDSPLRITHTGVQTNEYEILNRDLLIGDIKFMLPSKKLIADIERNRAEAKKRAMLKAQRKFEEHAEKQEEHLNDLKEFLEKAAITKRPRKPRDCFEYDKKLLSSMDELLSRDLPKAESITDIKGRIEKKEKELLNLFETVENMTIFGAKN